MSASAAHAAPDCLAAPDRTSGPGTHWYYRIDRATQRKCWYLKQFDGRASSAAATQPTAPRQDAENQPQLFSWLSSAFSSMRRSTPEPDVVAREAGPSATDTARRRERRQARRADVSRAPPRASAQPAAVSSEAPVRSQAQPAAAVASPAPPRALDPVASEALYQQFLQWRVKQLLAPELPPDLQGGSLR